ncbi:hypothetical protein HanXRQr2_Chr09g0415011 [Helianthus annuus]|uniref:Uncharacterized protein n=1 Tax=Helianthus annuus TaxID=4232 RepID=A0A9K3NAD2_HELAN|nr:hypothetical protein HanXRQr2_Chr09g0415011 [Helianthus annuus]KAJ0895489.1 hypothetical protein HanPSC8_Chr09g0401161 [Helianthus annuus]
MNYLSSLRLSFNKNFSLSSSATLTSLSSKCFLSSTPRLSISTSLDGPVDPKSKPFLNRSKVGSFSREAHFRASSSSSSREDFEKTSIPELLHTEVLPDLKLVLLTALKLPNLILLAALYMSLPSIIIAIKTHQTKYW